MTTYGTESGIALVSARVRDFRSLADIEVDLSALTVLIGANNAGKTSFLDALVAAIGAGRKSLTADDVRLAPGEPTAPKARDVIIDVMLRPIGADGKVLDGATSGNLCIVDSWPGQMRTVYGDHQRFVDTYFKTYLGKYFTGVYARPAGAPRPERPGDDDIGYAGVGPSVASAHATSTWRQLSSLASSVQTAPISGRV